VSSSSARCDFGQLDKGALQVLDVGACLEIDDGSIFKEHLDHAQTAAEANQVTLNVGESFASWEVPQLRSLVGSIGTNAESVDMSGCAGGGTRTPTGFPTRT
jgi:hypothetical protein